MPDHSVRSVAPQHRRTLSETSENSGGLNAVLLRLFDAALATCVVVVPLTMAGIREFGVGLFVWCSCVMAVLWAVRQMTGSGGGAPIGAPALIGTAAIALVWLQLQPLPNDVLHQLSPFNADYLTLWGTASGQILGQSDWQQISVTPEATRSGFVLLIAYVLFFLSLTQRLSSQHDIDRLVRLIGLSGIVMAAIGIGQIMVGDGRFLFFIEHPTRSAAFPAKGTFTNQNHFAHFMALAIGPMLWWWSAVQPDCPSDSRHQRQSGRNSGSHNRSTALGARPQEAEDRRILLGIGAGTALLSLAAVLSASRGGIAVFGLAFVVGICSVIRSWRSTLKLTIPIALFLAAALIAFGTDELNERWEQVTGAESIRDLSRGRWVLWTALSQAVLEFLPAGAGVGSHADVYPIWMSEQFDVRFSHAECGYLQILLETGIPGITLLLSAICLTGFWLVQGWRRGNRRQRQLLTALAAGLLASLVHSVFDFVWYIPGCMILTLATLACLSRCSQLTASDASTSSAGFFRLPTLIAAGLLLLILPTAGLFADTVRRDMTSAQHWNSFHSSMLEIVEGNADPVEELNARLDTLISHLEHCIRQDPFHHDAWSSLAPLYLQRFEQRSRNGDNQMSLQDIRDTISQADFAGEQEMHEWLVRAFGEDVQDLHRAILAARRALRYRPLRSEAYLVLSETSFLTSPSTEVLADVIDQAVRLRPHEPRVLYAAGLLAMESGDTTSAWDQWRHASALDHQIARQIIDRFVDRMPVTELLERLQPGTRVYFELFAAYQGGQRADQQRTIAVAFADTFETAVEGLRQDNVNDWKRCAGLLVAADRQEDAAECLRRAVRLVPQDLVARRRYAGLLSELGELREARRELAWLSARIPNDEQIAELLEDVESRYNAEYHRDRIERLRRRTDTIRPVSHVARQPVTDLDTAHEASPDGPGRHTADVIPDQPIPGPWTPNTNTNRHAPTDDTARMPVPAPALPAGQQHQNSPTPMRVQHDH